MSTLTRFGVAAFAIATVFAIAPAAGAATIEVNRLGDPAPNGCTKAHCTLREAVLRANNASPGPDVVLLPNRRRAYRLAIPNASTTNEDGSMTGDLDVTNGKLTVRHPGRGFATVDGNGLDRVFHGFAPLTLKRIRITGGDSTGNVGEDAGGGVLTHTRLRVVRCHVTGNSGDHGGGVGGQAGNRVEILRSRITRNTDEDAGAGVFLSEGQGRISRSQIVRNEMTNDSEAGGINIFDSTLRINRSTIANNVSEREGGGIVSASSELHIKSSTISGNRALEAGGGLYLFDGNTTLINSTVAGNRTPQSGGGIAVNGVGELSLNAVTISRNLANTDDLPMSETGGGIAHDSTGSVTVSNSILALNRLGPGPRNDCTGNPVVSGGGNLLSSLGPSDVCQGFDGAGDTVRQNPRIGKLSKNGGPTKTVPLKRGSPAIGRARADSAPGRDQRGHKRDQNPDSGAFER